MGLSGPLILLWFLRRLQKRTSNDGSGGIGTPPSPNCHLPHAPNNLLKKHGSTETNSVFLDYFGLQTPDNGFITLLPFSVGLRPFLQYIILYCMYNVFFNVSSVFRHFWHSFDTPSLASLLVPLQTVLVRTHMDVAPR